MKHKSVTPLRSIPPIKRALSSIMIVLSIVTALTAFGVPVTTSFTYQGQLRRSGTGYTGTCNFQFSLWDAASGGTQQGSTQAINSVNVANGLFTVTLDFTENAFAGEARWLATSVQCSGDSGFTSLDPRQSITAAPYAHSLRPGARIDGNNSAVPTLSVNNLSASGYGLAGSSQTGVYGSTTTTDGSGVYGQGNGGNSAGVFGNNSDSAAIWGRTTGGGSAIYGENTGGGRAGSFLGPVNVAGNFTVTNSTGPGINASGSAGVVGTTLSTTGRGVQGNGPGSGPNSAGVYGLNNEGAAIWGQSIGTGSAIYGENTSGGYAGRFLGPLLVQGTLSKSAGSFKIDHPLDPANKFLSHSFVESPDMKNIYDGNVTTDASGSVTVTLPDYFTALNRDYRYQLTVMGQFAQAIISREIAGNSFEIHTDKPGVKVSWQVTGIRQDAYAQEHPIVVEELKPAEQKGLYLYPAGFGAGEEKLIGHSSRPDTAGLNRK